MIVNPRVSDAPRRLAIHPEPRRDGSTWLQHSRATLSVSRTRVRCTPYDVLGKGRERSWLRTDVYAAGVKPVRSATGEPVAEMFLTLRDGSRTSRLLRGPHADVEALAIALNDLLREPSRPPVDGPIPIAQPARNVALPTDPSDPARMFRVTRDYLHHLGQTGGSWRRESIADVIVHLAAVGKSRNSFALRLIRRDETPVSLHLNEPEPQIELIAAALRRKLQLPTRRERAMQYLSSSPSASSNVPSASKVIQRPRGTIDYATFPEDAPVVERWATGVRLYLPPLTRATLIRDGRSWFAVACFVLGAAVLTPWRMAMPVPPVMVPALFCFISGLAMCKHLFDARHRTIVLECSWPERGDGTLMLSEVSTRMHKQTVQHWPIDGIAELRFDDNMGRSLSLRLPNGLPVTLARVVSKPQLREVARCLLPAMGFDGRYPANR